MADDKSMKIIDEAPPMNITMDDMQVKGDWTSERTTDLHLTRDQWINKRIDGMIAELDTEERKAEVDREIIAVRREEARNRLSPTLHCVLEKRAYGYLMTTMDAFPHGIGRPPLSSGDCQRTCECKVRIWYAEMLSSRGVVMSRDEALERAANVTFMVHDVSN